MPTNVTIYGFDTSNNIKVRIALGYKGIGYEFHTIEPSDRAAVVRVSGQHLTPVMVHGENVLFDSAAILRYLDANFPRTPKLFGDSLPEQWEIEDWEMFARTSLAGPMLTLVHSRVLGEALDDAAQQDCASAFAAAVTRLAEHMTDRSWMVSDRMTAADITAVAVLFRVRSANIFPLPQAAAALTDWEERVLLWDGKHRVEP